MSEKDIVIIGGGPVGSVLALALQQHGIAATVLEARAKGASHKDTRALALSYGSRIILERLGVWNEIEGSATAIKKIHISQRGGLGRTKLSASDHNLPALGYVLPYGALTKVLDDALEETEILYQAVASQVNTDKDCGQIDFQHAGESKTFFSQLVVIADGGNSLGEVAGIKRETKEYGHSALVSIVHCELPHDSIAYERFTPQGPMALLPNGNHDFSLVWTGEKDKIDGLLALDDATFLTQLHEAFGDRVGSFLRVGKRLSFPLKLSTLKPVIASHLAVIGNAAQTMHPVAGQGFNVGLRDAWTLADLIIHPNESERLGSDEMLRAYEKQRQRDKRGSVLFTDFLVNTFSNDLLGVSALRGVGLGFLDILQPAKSFLVGKMSYGK